MVRKWSASALALLVVSAAPAWAQFGAPNVVKVTAAPVKAAGGSAQLRVTIAVQAGYHVQANTARSPNIPTKVVVTAPKGVRVGVPVFPAGKKIRLGGQTLDVFGGNVVVIVPITAAPGTAGPRKLGITVSFQACNDQTCFPPDQKTTAATVTFGKPPKPKRKADAGAAAIAAATGTGHEGAATTPPSSDYLAGFTVRKVERFLPPGEFVAFVRSGPVSDSGAGSLGKLLGTGHLLLALPLVFLLGLALNLTPCVYPIIPITIGYFGSQAGVSGRKPVTLAIFYVLGIALMYSVLGVAAGLTGGLFGAQLQNPWVLCAFALVMFALALSQFDRPNGMPIWEFQLPASMRNQASPRSGIVGAVFMGLLVGVVAAPCIGPAVVALLQWVGTQRSPVLGFLVFFTLAVGLGLPYVLLAIASGSVKKLPRSGEWMVGVKHVFGVVMVWMGFYYLQTVLNLLRPEAGRWALVAVTAVGAVFLLFLDRAGASSRGFAALRRVLGVGAAAAAVWLAAPAPKQTIEWRAFTPAAVTSARAEGKSVLIDFTAAWCAQCKELEHKTFSDQRVGAACRDLVALRGDMTEFGGPQAQEWRSRFGIRGLPTVVLLTPAR